MPLHRSLTAPVGFQTWERYQSAVAELMGHGYSVVTARRSVTDACLALGAVSPLAVVPPAPSAKYGLPIRVEKTAVVDACFARFRLPSVEGQRAYAAWALEAHVRQALPFWLTLGEADRQAVFRTVGFASVLAI